MSSPLTLHSVVTVPSTPPTTQPRLGWGSWPSKGTTCTASVLSAISAGYRHFDSAQAYGNEAAIGDAIAQTDVPRSQLYLTSKIHINDANPPTDVEEVYKGIEESVKKMNGGKDSYLDLMLIHGAAVEGGKYNEAQWKALEKAYKNGLAKAIGVSNAGKGLIEDMKSYAQVWPPHVNQIELHPWCQQNKAVAWCHSQKMVVQAYSPIVRNSKANDPTLKGIAEKHKKSAAQILIRYALQKNWVPLPKSDDPARIRENADIYDFELSQEDMDALNGLDQGPAGAMDEDAWAVADMKKPT